MPIDPITAAATITAVANTANAAATGKQNKKSRQFSRETYAKTKADNIQFWNMQNEYNSPSAQMARLKEAGLNPNMVYDKGGAVQPAGNIATPDVQGGQFRTPDFGSIGTGLVQGYFDTKIKQAQYDNLKAQNTVALQEAALKAAQVAGEVSRTEGQGYSNIFAKTNLNNALEQAGLQTKKLNADIQYTLSENERKAAMQAPNLLIAAQTVLKMKADTASSEAQREQILQNIQNLKQDYRLKVFEEDLAKQGIFKWDPLWARALAQFLQGLTGEVTSFTGIGKQTRDYLDKPFRPQSESTLSGNMGTFHYFYNKFRK
jgi:hypothetical protein